MSLLPVIYELAHREQTTATQLADELGINPGYLSRILRTLQDRELVQRRPSEHDGRQSLLSLSGDGQKAFAMLNAASRSQVAEMLESLCEEDQRALLGAMEAIERILGMEPEQRVPFILRPPEPGDLGWIVHRHGVLYAREYGYDETFEALVAEIVARFVKSCDPKKERCWIAEREGENVGSVLLVRDEGGDEDSVARQVVVVELTAPEQLIDQDEPGTRPLHMVNL